MPETTPLIKAALNLRVGAGFDVYEYLYTFYGIFCFDILDKNADKTKKYRDLYILHDNSRQNLTVHLPVFRPISICSCQRSSQQISL